MTYISRRAAAALCGRSRNTLAVAIDSGKLSVTAEGIDPAELARVFPFTLPTDAAPETEPAEATPEPARATADAQRIAKLEHENERLREAIYGMADRAFDLAENSQSLARQIQERSQPEPAPEPPRALPAPGLLRRLLSSHS